MNGAENRLSRIVYNLTVQIFVKLCLVVLVTLSMQHSFSEWHPQPQTHDTPLAVRVSFDTIIEDGSGLLTVVLILKLYHAILSASDSGLIYLDQNFLLQSVILKFYGI